MKKILLFAIIALCAACSGDDDNTYYPAPVTGSAVPSKITVDNGTPSEKVTYTLEYDSEKRISKIFKDAAGDRTYLFTYNNDDQVATLATTGTDPGLLTFDYDVFMRLQQITLSGQPVPVTYNANTEVYTMSSYQFKYLPNGEMDRLMVYQFHYDTSKKGPFANINSSYQLLGILSDGLFVQCGSKSAYTSWDINNNPGVLYTTTYDAEGMPSQSILSGFLNLTITYEYTRI